MSDEDTYKPNDVHAYPLNDLREHLLVGVSCPCIPSVTLEGATLIVTHNAFDHREIVEEAMRILRGEE
jgi:hypothetical protein